VKIRSCRQGMADLGHLAHHIRSRWREQRSTVVARNAILGRGIQTWRRGRSRP
jgi:hypothetical protein